MSTINTLQREFGYRRGGTEHVLPDPNPEMTPNEVRKFYSARFAELANASVEGPVTDKGVLKFKFTTNIGTKG